MNSRLKKWYILRLSDILCFFLLLPLYRPPYLATEGFTFLDGFFVYGKILSFIVVVLMYARKAIRKKINYKNTETIGIVIYLCFYLCVFVGGIINGDMSNVGSAFLPVITAVLMFLYYLEDDITKMLYPLSLILTAYVVINFATVLVFPEGLYSQKVNEMSTRIEYSWFLGYRNPQIRVLLPAVAISFICDVIKFGKIKVKSIALFACSVMTVFMVHSSTAMIGFAVCIAIYVLRLKWNIKVRPIWFVYLNIGFFIFIVILRLQNIFSFFIVNILGKTTTFSARTIIWDQALLQVYAHPLFGTGANEFAIGSYFVATHPHNLFLYLMLKGGLLGFGFFLMAMIICSKRLNECQDSLIIQILIMEFCAFFTMTLAESMTEAIFFWLVIPMGICSKKLLKYDVRRVKNDWNSNTTKCK